MSGRKKSILQAILLASVVTLVIATHWLRHQHDKQGTANSLKKSEHLVQWSWEVLPLPDVEHNRIRSFAIDREGTIWSYTIRSIHYWDTPEQKWNTVQKLVSPTSYNTEFYGNSELGLHWLKPIKQPPGETSKRREMQLYLADKTAPQSICRIQYFPNSHRPGFTILSEGRYLNWNREKIRIYSDGKWHDQDASLPTHATKLMATEESVALFYKDTIHVIDRHKGTSPRTIHLSEPPRGILSLALLANDKLIYINPDFYSHPLLGISLIDGTALDCSLINKSMGRVFISRLYATNDDVWVVAYDRDKEYKQLFRIDENLQIHLIKGSSGIDDINHQQILTATDGTTWTIMDYGVVKIKNDQMHRFDYRMDTSPFGPRKLLLSPKGHLHLSTGKVHIYRPKIESENHVVEEPPKAIKPPTPIWTYLLNKDYIDKAWLANETIIIEPNHRRNSLLAIDANTGKLSFSVDSNSIPDPEWAIGTTSPDKILLFSEKEAVTLNSETGEVEQRSALAHRRRYRPIGLNDGFIMRSLPEKPGTTRHTPDHQLIWESDSTFSHQTSPVEKFTLLAAHGTSKRRSGRSTYTIDTHTGEIVWSKSSKIEGMGTVFSPDHKYIYEYGNNITRFDKTFHVIARESTTGEEAWSKEIQGNLFSQTAIVDASRNHLRLLSNEGELHCLNLTDGSIAWQNKIDFRPAHHILGLSQFNREHDPDQYRFLLSVPEFTAVLGTDWMLHFIHNKTGRTVCRMHFMDLLVEDYQNLHLNQIRGGPWIIDQTIIVPTHNRIDAYSINEIHQLLMDEINSMDTQLDKDR